MQRYPNISDHGLIGDLQTAALVSTDGTVNWFCCPRFDSPSVFASLLDADKGGYFRIAPENECVTRQLYFPDTAVLITRFMSADGVGEIYDFMPIAGKRATTRHRLVRQCRVVRGTMKFILELQPRFDYARATHTTQLTNDGAVFRAEGTISAAGGAGAAGELTQLARRAGRDHGTGRRRAAGHPHAAHRPVLGRDPRIGRRRAKASP